MLAFELEAPSGHYVHFKAPDGRDVGVGVPYQISVCRYFGDGTEESDGGSDPNIELDGFGLFLSAFSDYVSRSGDEAFYHQYQGRVETLVADALLHCIDNTGLVRAESGPWERHLKFKHFSYTSVAAAAGLRDFAALEQRMGATGWQRYQDASQSIEAAVRQKLVTADGWMLGNLEAAGGSGYDTHDGGTFEGFADGVLPSSLLPSHLKEYNQVLHLPEAWRGYSRINQGDDYETSEWIMLNLRAASAMEENHDRAGARRLAGWVTAQARRNYDLLPEEYSRKTWAYDGAVPMVGFGAGAYVLTLSDLHPRL